MELRIKIEKATCKKCNELRNVEFSVKGNYMLFSPCRHFIIRDDWIKEAREEVEKRDNHPVEDIKEEPIKNLL